MDRKSLQIFICLFALACYSHSHASVIRITQDDFTSSATLIDFEGITGDSLPATYGNDLGVNLNFYGALDHSRFQSLETTALSNGLGSKGGTWHYSRGNDFAFYEGQDKVGFWLGSNVQWSTTFSFYDTENNLLDINTAGAPISGNRHNYYQWYFYGFTTDDATKISSVDLGFGSNSFIQIDNLIFESTSVPEPSIVALFAAGLAGLGYARRRRPQVR